MKTCVICISKGSHDSINDWVEHYLNLGFNHIFIFDNNEYEHRYNIDNQNVSLIPYYNYPMFTGDPEWRQCILIKIGLVFAFDQGYDYSLICDDDEYINFKGNYNNINDFIDKYGNYDNILIFMENMSDNGYLYISDEPKYKKLNDIYTKPTGSIKWVKTIFKTPDSYHKRKHIICKENIHIMHYVNDKNYIEVKPDDTTMYHYKTYCLERYLIKKSQLQT